MIKNVLIILAFLIAIAGGWSVPDLFSTNSQVVESGQTGEQSGEKVKWLSQDGWTYPDRMVLKRMEDGHFYARVNINGKPIQFVVDTGASFIALTGKDPKALGYKWSSSDLEVVGSGASGAVRGKHITIKEAQLAGFHATNLRGAIIPRGLEVSLLGQNFLRRVPEVKIASDKMVLLED